MNFTLQGLLELIGIALDAVSKSAKGELADGAEAGEYFLQIAQKSAAAYQAQTGKPIDPTLLRPEAPIT